MKKTIFLIIISILIGTHNIYSANEKISNYPDIKGYAQKSYTFDNFNIVNEKNKKVSVNSSESSVKIDGLKNTNSEGNPSLPFKTIHKVYKGHYKINDILIKSGNIYTSNVVNINPGHKLLSWEEDKTSELISDKNMDIYNSDSFYPGKWISYVSGFDGENTHVYIKVYTCQWNPQTKEFLHMNNYSISIDADKAIIPAVKKKSEEIESASAEHIIITPRKFENQVEQLKQVSTAQNKSCDIVILEDIYENYEMAEKAPDANSDLGEEYFEYEDYDYDGARKIISYLRDKSAHPNMDMITLIGNSKLLPTSFYWEYGSFNPEFMPTDIYYSSPDYDLVENYSLSRISIRTADDLSEYIKKVKNWLSNLDGEWTKTVSVSGFHPFNMDIYVGESICNQVIREGIFNGMNIEKNYGTRGDFDVSDLMNRYNNWNELFHFMICHGSGTSILLMDHERLTIDHLMTLKETKTPPVYISIACINGAFDTDQWADSPYQENSDYSYGETLLRAPGGSISYIGGSRSNYGMPIVEMEEGNITYTNSSYMFTMLKNFLASWHELEQPRLADMAKLAKEKYLAEEDFDVEINQQEYRKFVNLNLASLLLPSPPAEKKEKSMVNINAIGQEHDKKPSEKYQSVKVHKNADVKYQISNSDDYELFTQDFMVLPSVAMKQGQVKKNIEFENSGLISKLLNRIETEDGTEYWHYSLITKGNHILGDDTYWTEAKDLGNSGTNKDIKADLERVKAFYDPSLNAVYLRLYVDLNLKDYTYEYPIITLFIDDDYSSGFTENISSSYATAWYKFDYSLKPDKQIAARLYYQPVSSEGGQTEFELKTVFTCAEYDDYQQYWNNMLDGNTFAFAVYSKGIIDYVIDASKIDINKAKFLFTSCNYRSVVLDCIPFNSAVPKYSSQYDDKSYAVTLRDYFMLNQLPTDIEESEAISLSKVNLYPNPASEHLQIDIKEKGFANYTLKISDMNGKDILTKSNMSGNSHMLNIDSFAPGIYFLELQSANKVIRSKFIKF